jgi:diketogulonate reductase-like aldo/keto reductase
MRVQRKHSQNHWNDYKWISNFQMDRLVDLMAHNEVIPTVNQNETHPFCQQIESAKLMKENNVQIESWAPFAEGKGSSKTSISLTLN